jgi:hypothetical protein
MNKQVRKNFFILSTKVLWILQKTQNEVAHHNRIIEPIGDQPILALGTAKVQLSLGRKS